MSKWGSNRPMPISTFTLDRRAIVLTARKIKRKLPPYARHP
jgi:hypothetical protein